METWEKITGGVITFAFGLIGFLGKRNLDQIEKKCDNNMEEIKELARITHEQSQSISSLLTASQMQHESVQMLLQKAIDD